MKKTFLIIETWNGEGYSEENKLNSIITATEETAEVLCKSLATKQVEVNLGHQDYGIERRLNGHIFHTGDDSGSFQYFEKTDDAYGIVIYTNINEAKVLTKDEFDAELTTAIENADMDELDELLDDGLIEPTDYEGIFHQPERLFIHGCEDEYDRQFIVL